MTLIDAVEYCKDPEGLRELEESYEDRRRQRILKCERDEAISGTDLKSTSRTSGMALRATRMARHHAGAQGRHGEDTCESVIARGIRTRYSWG